MFFNNKSSNFIEKTLICLQHNLNLYVKIRDASAKDDSTGFGIADEEHEWMVQHQLWWHRYSHNGHTLKYQNENNPLIFDLAKEFLKV